MKHISLFAVSLVSLCASVVACDDKSSGAAPAASVTAKVEAKADSTPPKPAAAEPPPRAPRKKATDCKQGPTVEFSDPALEVEVRRKLGKDKGTLSPADLKGVRTLNLAGGSVSELDPCVFPLLLGVKDIFLGPGDLFDLSPIANLVQLESLRASVNKVTDVTPLAKLTKLDRLDLGRTAVRDLKPLVGLVNLTELQLDETEVSDLSPIAGATKMEKLSIKKTQVKDLTPLKGMTKLRFLYLEGTPVDDVSPLGPLAAKGLKVIR